MKTYNGWTNFETWKVNLEYWDSTDILKGSNLSTYEAGQRLKELTEEHIFESTEPNSLAQSLSIAFLSEVNWNEIAEHLLEH